MLALGVLAKETVVLMVPTYLACNWRKGLPALARTAVLAVVCILAFLAVRIPLGWRPGYQKINGTEALMIGSNLGLADAPYSVRLRPSIKTICSRPYFSACLCHLLSGAGKRSIPLTGYVPDPRAASCS